MRLQNRKTTPKVISGKVQRKNNWTLTAEYQGAAQTMPVVDRRRAGHGYKHLLTQQHLTTFIGLLPDWDELAIGLNTVVLAPGERGTDGWHAPGTIAICAWERELWHPATIEFCREHADLLDRLGVASEAIKGGRLLQWTQDQATAYQLLHVFLHELG